MQLLNEPGITVEQKILTSRYLKRDVVVDFYLPTHVENPETMDLLLINDGQNLAEMKFTEILATLYTTGRTRPILSVGIHAGTERKMEYGIASQPDYLGRGAKAGDYTMFVLRELLPFIRVSYAVTSFANKAIAGFSLGGLSAFDIAWEHPPIFDTVGVFSGSLWWRSVDQEDSAYDDNLHRIAHQLVHAREKRNGMRFFFQSGNMDETNDRNNNGIIDSIDDTLDLIAALRQKGYSGESDIHYLEMPDGKHDIETWGRAMRVFLEWFVSRES